MNGVTEYAIDDIYNYIEQVNDQKKKNHCDLNL